jgi:tetratricopeptide (TPR) repeat protein
VLQGFIHELNHRIHEAQRFYRKAAQYISDNSKQEDIESGMEAYLNLGFVELDLHNHQHAIEMFRKALAMQEEYHNKIDKLEILHGKASDVDGRILTHKPALIATCYNNIGHTYVHVCYIFGSTANI